MAMWYNIFWKENMSAFQSFWICIDKLSGSQVMSVKAIVTQGRSGYLDFRQMFQALSYID